MEVVDWEKEKSGAKASAISIIQHLLQLWGIKASGDFILKLFCQVNNYADKYAVEQEQDDMRCNEWEIMWNEWEIVKLEVEN